MALQFKPSGQEDNNQQVQQNAAAQPVPVPEVEVVPQSYDIIEAKNEMAAKIMNSDEIDKLTSTIDINNPNTVVNFGAPAAEEISKASDIVLRSMNMDQINDSGRLLQSLAEIMDQFDVKELAEEPKGFAKLFGNAKKEIEKILGKYNTMGDAIDKIYIQLKSYETEIGQTNVKLENMFQANMNYYNELIKYILAGEQGVKELDDYIVQYEAKLQANPNDGNIRMDLDSLMNTRDMLQQRVLDLKIAENVAMQSIPMLKTMEYSNLNLIRKINSAFIITMPVFKQALAQAVMLKRQKVQADALKALDDKTNEMLIRNAENTVAQSQAIARSAYGSSIQVETLQKTWQTIVTGIDETKRIQEESRQKRIADTQALERLNNDFRSKMGSR